MIIKVGEFMKILITVQTYYPKKDGVQNVTQYLAEGLVNKGHEITVITSSENNTLPFNETFNGVNIKRVNLYTKFGLSFGDKKGYQELIIKESKKCNIMINVCTQNAFTDSIISKIKKIKCKKILYLHGSYDFRINKLCFSSLKSFINKMYKNVRWTLYYKLNKSNIKNYDKVIQIHDKTYSYGFFQRKYNINADVIENAVNNDFFNSSIDKKFIKPFDKYIIYVANYDDNKNQKLAIREFLKSDIDGEYGLVLIGSRDNAYRRELLKYEKKLRNNYNIGENSKKIKILYNIDRSEISKYVSNADLYLMTSKSEVFPISILESMAAGVPYICTNVGVVKYFLGGIVSSESDISYWIEKLLSDENIRKEMGLLCKKYAISNYTIEDKVDKLNNIISNM